MSARTWFSVLRAWAAVHATQTAALTMLFVTLASLLFAETSISDLGIVRLITPVSVLLLLPVAAGTGAALACHNMSSLSLPDPGKAKVMRIAWAMGWTAIAVAGSVAGTLLGSEQGPLALTRNVLLFNGLGLLVLKLRQPNLVWLPGMAYMLSSILFGYPDHTSGADMIYYWWAVGMKAAATPSQFIWIGALYLISVIWYGPNIAFLRRRHTIRRNSATVGQEATPSNLS